MRCRIILSLILSVFFVFSPIVPAQTVVDTTLRMSDGVVLDAFYVYPTSPPPASGYPAVLLVHGFGGNKNGNRSAALAFARSGFASTSYSVRGQGASGGEFDFFTSDRIRADLQSMIDFTKALPRVNPGRIGVQGGSQGGIHAWMAAAYDMGVRAVASFVANGRFHENWLENHALNWTLAMTIRNTSVRFQQGVKDSLVRAMDSGDYSFTHQFLTEHSTRSLETSVSTPVAIYVSYYDGFFNPSAALGQFGNVNVPKRIVLYPGGHSLPQHRETNDFVIELNRQWWEYWLKDDENYVHVAAPDSAVVLFDGATDEAYFFSSDDEPYWNPDPWFDFPLPTGMSRLEWQLSSTGLETGTSAPESRKTINYIPAIGSAPLVLRSQPLENDMTLAARPVEVELWIEHASKHFQLNLLLYDYDPVSGIRLPVTRGHMEVPIDIGGNRAVIEFRLNTVMHTIRAGHQLEAAVHTGIALIPDFSTNFGNFVLPPTVLSSTTLILGGENSSRFKLCTYGSPVAGVSSSSGPAAFELQQNYPNPCNPSTTIAYNLEQSGYAKLAVFDLLGNEISVLSSHLQPAGRHRIVWNTSGVPSGTYFYRLRSNGHSLTRKLVVLK